MNFISAGMDTRNENNDDDDDDDDDSLLFADMGFMFEGANPSIMKDFKFDGSKNNGDDGLVVRVRLEMVDNDPGALQSGHYLWAAAPALANYLVENKNNKNRDDANNNNNNNVTCILELGAGCAMATLVALQVFSDTLKYAVVTDHDAGTLERAQRNYALSQEQHTENRNQQVVVEFQPLSWGDREGAKALLQKLKQEPRTTTAFDLILGSDLIYCLEVVDPLLTTAHCLMDGSDKGHAEFLLSQSFPYDDDIELEIDAVCHRLGLARCILVHEDDKKNSFIRIQSFRPNGSDEERGT